jgi:hypothetical protein
MGGLEMLDEFGDDYAEYMFSTGRAKEFLYGLKEGEDPEESEKFFGDCWEEPDGEE